MRRHPLDLLSLLAGLTTVVLAGVGLTDAWTLPLAPWAPPVVLVAAGVVVLGLVAVSSRDRGTQATDGPTDGVAAARSGGPAGDVAAAGTDGPTDGGGDAARLSATTRPLDTAALREELLADQDPSAPWADDTDVLRPADPPGASGWDPAEERGDGTPG